MTILEAIRYGIQNINSDTPQLDAEVLLSSVLKKDRLYLIIHKDDILDNEVLERYKEYVERRKKGEPVAYIINKKEFYGYEFYVEKGVLIPRPDTEILVEEVIKRSGEYENPVIVDVGCGSGAISVTLAKEIKGSRVFALDLMDIPIKVTKINAKRLGVEDRVQVIRSDIFENLNKELEGRVDIIVSNPPYIRDEVIPTLMTDVKDYEPYEALSGGEDGLIFYRRIAKEALKYLKRDGLIAFEIGFDQREELFNILSKDYKDIECIKDLAGLDRVILARRG
ncbi:peptide chain release factor N(5)-glutamine methyltransferase [Caloramator proteoclasticus]|uniref:Release factor glutamine methyltransferase n=1 Tax=Caloramator proteoclasticus DSM 10124 TaxID=1121262 RepID=A0A1M4S9W0_9CLOT|nr:peptide chain release factor N(5)-glutamine methyltransferase [Caloramator proteoclasticus]SHE28979.1 release factor glutamine methyltransferase [Caloramator proteoclasticus DSM 10124]